MDKDNYDLQRELEEKFDELFGTVDASVDLEDEEEFLVEENTYENQVSTLRQNERSGDDIPSDIQAIITKGSFSDDQIHYIKKIPWNKLEVPNINIENAKSVLQKSHYGMYDVKERILRYIACQKHLGKAYGVILLLVGPPGVGKTSIVKSIAEALNREFVKISLAGMADADPLKGYDRNYKQAKPGEIINAIIRAESFCPLILLDEIDKMGKSQQHGNPAHVLLDILDSDRTHFTDNMIEIPIDLSNIIFVATANNIENISPILLDRLEIIKLKGYTNEEKLCIAQNYLIPKLVKEYQIDNLDLKFTTDLVEFIIENYTSEAGIRSLERHLRTICETVISYKYITQKVPQIIDISEFKKIMDTSYFEISKQKSINKAVRKRKRSIRKKIYNIDL
ncbi:MAG: AAA family ATPase [Lachnospiraceae bacterium]|nr:AAA family ATPase [Lachnospiraceae bacterium]